MEFYFQLIEVDNGCDINGSLVILLVEFCKWILRRFQSNYLYNRKIFTMLRRI